MIYLSSHDAFQRIAFLSDPDGPLEFTTRDASGCPRPLDPARWLGEKVPTGGSYGTVDGKLMALFVWEDRLYLRYQDVRLVIAGDTSVRVETHGGLRDLTVLKDGATLLRCTYANPPLPPDTGVLDPYDEEENYDFGLFVANIINDKSRQMVLRSIPGESLHPSPPFDPHGFRIWATCLILPLGGWALKVWPFMPGLPTDYGILSIILVALGAGLALVPVPGIWMASDIMCAAAFITGAVGFVQAMRGVTARRRWRIVFPVVGLFASVILTVGNHL